MSVNRIDTTLTNEQRDRANPTLAALAVALPFLFDLSAIERADNPKFGDKNRAYIVKTPPSTRAHPHRFPFGFNRQTL